MDDIILETVTLYKTETTLTEIIKHLEFLATKHEDYDKLYIGIDFSMGSYLCVRIKRKPTDKEIEDKRVYDEGQCGRTIKYHQEQIRLLEEKG